MRHSDKSPQTKAERIVVVSVDTATGWGRSIIRGVHRQAQVRPGWRLLVDDMRDGERVDLLVRGRIHGVIARVNSAGTAHKLVALKVPVVNVSAIAVPEATFPRVATDVEAAARMAAAYFLERGFRSFGYLSLIKSDYVARQRSAFHEAVARAGYPCGELSLGDGEQTRGDPVSSIALTRWLRLLPKPVGIFTWSGGSELIHACRKAGISVPEEVALLSGSDDDLMCEVCEIPISAVQQPAEQIGSEAALMLECLMNQGVVAPAMRWLAPAAIVTRLSTNTLAVEDPVLVAALRFIREASGRPVQVDDIATAAGVSRRVLERRFSERLRASPATFLRRSRLEAAKALLTGTDLPIPEVATAAGFCSPAYLAQAFRTGLGVTPLRYRQATRAR